MRYSITKQIDMCDQPITVVIDTQASDSGIIAHFFSKDQQEHAEAFISAIDTFKQSLEQLGMYIAEDDVEKAYEILANVENDNDLADDYIAMWEPFENKYTVWQLLDQCGF
jgi:hypothetical protein